MGSASWPLPRNVPFSVGNFNKPAVFGIVLAMVFTALAMACGRKTAPASSWLMLQVNGTE
jgi:hypothetical protein